MSDNPKLLRAVYRNGTINGSLSTGAVRKIIARYGRRIGVEGLNPHDLRRSLARAARKAGAPLETIQHTLGHSSVRTTEIYTRTGEEANAGDWIFGTNQTAQISTNSTMSTIGGSTNEWNEQNEQKNQNAH